MKCVIDNEGLFESYINNLFIKDMQPQIKRLVFNNVEQLNYSKTSFVYHYDYFYWLFEVEDEWE